MTRCPNCGAHREENDDYCPVCGETFDGPLLSEVTGVPWYERTRLVAALVVFFWPAALLALFERNAYDQEADQWLLGGCLVMVAVSVLLLRAL
jgi:predicted amidophosphoribosyltransferase